MSEIQQPEKTKENNNQPQTVTPHQFKPVFYVIHKGEIDPNELIKKSKLPPIKLTAQEHFKLIEILWKFGKDYISECKNIFPNKEISDIDKYVQNILSKIKKINKNEDIFEYIRSKPKDYFISREFDKSVKCAMKQGKKRELTFTKKDKNEELLKKRKLYSEEPIENSLTSLKISNEDKPNINEVLNHEDALPEVTPKEETRKVKVKTNTIKKKPQKRKSEAAKPVESSNSEKSAKKSDQHAIPPESKFEQRDFIEEAKVPSGIATKQLELLQPSNPPAAGSAPQTIQMNPYENFGMAPNYSYPIPASNNHLGPSIGQSSMMQGPYQYPAVPSKLMEIMQELRNVTDGMNNEKPNFKPVIDNDPQFRFYWESLESCTVSLHHLISDICTIHVNTQPMQTQFMYPTPQTMYYPQTQDARQYMAATGQTGYYGERQPGPDY